MKTLLAAIVFVALLAPSVHARPSVEDVARRVGQQFAGYDDFWVWVTQRFKDKQRRVATHRGRAYFKRDKMFRLNFGQPASRIEGTDGTDYWVYDRQKKTIIVTGVDDKRDPHPLLIVFAAGDQMVRALNRFFNVDAPLEDVEYETEDGKKVPAYKLVVSLKPEKLKQMRKDGNKLVNDKAKQTWTFWIDKKKNLPLCVQFDWADGTSYTFVLGRFHTNVGLRKEIFRIPRPKGVKVIRVKGE
jgi:outer membrane lipoprotein-sorting protein